jgi:uncharacterized protein
MKHLITVFNLSKKMLQGLLITLSTLMIVISLLISPAQATGIYDLPVINAGESVWVIDQAQTLSLTNEGRLNNSLADLAQNTNYEVRMVAIRRLDYGETIDSFADQLFQKWFPTVEKQENQLLVVMDTLTNNTAIRAGSQVQSLLSSSMMDSIISETMGYPLRESKYNQALLDSSDRIVAILSGKPDPGPPMIKEINVESTFTSAEETDDQSATVWVVGFLIIATIIPMVTYWWYVK